MNDIVNHTADSGIETTASDAPALVSLTDWAATTEQAGTNERPIFVA